MPFKLFLAGDAGENDSTGATLRDLKIKLLENPNSAVIFLGDNCYKKLLGNILKAERKGFDGKKITRNRLMSQLNILKHYSGSAFFVPGNHDWWNSVSVKKGRKHLLKEELFIEDSLRSFTALRNNSSGTFFPKKGEAGPETREFANGKVIIIFIDTYRLILEELKHKKKNIDYLNVFYNNFSQVLKSASDKNQKIIIAAHHPIQAKGKHSGKIKWLHNQFRRFANSYTNYKPNKLVAAKIDSLLKLQKQGSIYYTSGHEHSLEYFYNNGVRYIVSGAASKTDKLELESVEKSDEFLKWNEEGFFEIDFYNGSEKVLMYHRKDLCSELQVDCLQGCDD